MLGRAIGYAAKTLGRFTRAAGPTTTKAATKGASVVKVAVKTVGKGVKEGVQGAVKESVHDALYNPSVRRAIIEALQRGKQITFALHPTFGGELQLVMLSGDPGLTDPGSGFPTACSCKIMPRSTSPQGNDYKILDCSFCGTKGQKHADLKRVVEAAIFGKPVTGPENVRDLYLAHRRGQTMRQPRASPKNYRVLAGFPPLPKSPSKSRSRSRSRRTRTRLTRSASARLRRTVRSR